MIDEDPSASLLRNISYTNDMSLYFSLYTFTYGWLWRVTITDSFTFIYFDSKIGLKVRHPGDWADTDLADDEWAISTPPTSLPALL